MAEGGGGGDWMDATGSDVVGAMGFAGSTGGTRVSPES
jgi:hypothetical protein